MSQPYAPVTLLAVEVLPVLAERVVPDMAPALLDSLAEVHSIVVALNALEGMYIRDEIHAREQYTNAALRLISQYQTLMGQTDVAVAVGSLPEFVARYDMNTPLAVARLARGVPATMELSTYVETPQALRPDTPSGDTKKMSSKSVLAITGAFITCLDNIKLRFLQKRQLHTALAEIVTRINEASDGDYTFPGKPKLVQWLIKINLLGEYDELGEAESGELMEDVTRAMEGFVGSLED